MRLLVLNKVNGGRIALLPTGGLLVDEIVGKDVTQGKTEIYVGTRLGYQVHESFDQTVENLNTELEAWRS